MNGGHSCGIGTRARGHHSWGGGASTRGTSGTVPMYHVVVTNEGKSSVTTTNEAGKSTVANITVDDTAIDKVAAVKAYNVIE